MNRMILAAAAAIIVAGAPAVATGAPAADTFVLIATNNRSLEPGRPALRYADDDGAKYYELFRMIAPRERVYLLTELDRDTAQLFPDLAAVARPPSRAAIAEAARAIARDVAAARRAGRATQLYVIYAGHGDIDGGRGYLELADARFYSDDLERLLIGIGAARSHVILDSCNSFFVLNARKPGGRRFATPEDAARNLGARLPDVGVFLSTSAEADVFEWSQLQSGIFSHAVRSGLAGGADANADGVISYEELAAFVEVAAAGVRNAAYRPKVFARGPRGDDRVALFAASPAQSVGLALGDAPARRLTIRDSAELPWFDVHPEPGAPLVLHLPAERLAGGAVVEHAAPALRRWRLGTPVAGALLRWSALETDPSATSTRGPADLFGALFDRPFGPRALAAFRDARRRDPAPVFGIAASDARELEQLLLQVRADSRRARLLGTSALLGVGFAATIAGTLHLAAYPDERAVGYSVLGAGAALALFGGIKLFVPDGAERLAGDFARSVERGEDAAQVVARASNRLEQIRRRYRRNRTIMGWAGIGMVAAGTAGLIVNEAYNPSDDGRGFLRVLMGGYTVLGAWTAAISRVPYPIEHMAELWNTQSSVRRLTVSASPLVDGAALTVSGGF